MCDCYGYEPEDQETELKEEEPAKLAVPVALARSRKR